MKKTTMLILLALVPMLTQAQGTLYVSNLGQSSNGGVAVGNDSWIAQLFITGTNPNGYILNSIQLLTDPAAGIPSGFTVSIYRPSNNATPGTLLGNLNGSSNPSAGGVFSYSASGITLSSLAAYFIVVAASTPTSDGAFYWSLADTGLDTTLGDSRWGIYQAYETSSNGLDWAATTGQNIFQMAIYATPVPEPATKALFGLGVVGFGLWRLRQNK